MADDKVDMNVPVNRVMSEIAQHAEFLLEGSKGTFVVVLWLKGKPEEEKFLGVCGDPDTQLSETAVALSTAAAWARKHQP